MTVRVGPAPLTAAEVVAVARGGEAIELTEESLSEMARSRAIVEALAESPEPAYGISTGFGALATVHIPPESRAHLQESLIRSHAAGWGPEVEPEVVRATMLLRLHTLATGRTGVRPSTAQAYAAMMNAGILPVVCEHGSLGCSGDLAPLSHIALALTGEGEVRDRTGALVPAADALAEAGLAPVKLAEKEGLALINGTDGMLGMLVLALADLEVLLTTADISAAMSIEALLGTDKVLADDLQLLRPHPGQRISAANMRRVLKDSPIVASHAGPEDTRVQDAYSLRCAPQVNGAARDTLDYCAVVAGRELASAIDNPVVTLDGRVESNGNFHGAPVAYALDFLAIAAAPVLHHLVVVVHAARLVAGLAALADAHHQAALLAQPAHQRREIGVRRGDDDDLRPFGQRQVDRIHRERDVGRVLARGQVDHGPDPQALEGPLVLDRRLGSAVGAPHVRAAVVLGDPGHGLLDHVERDVVGVDQQHHLVLGHGAGPRSRLGRATG